MALRPLANRPPQLWPWAYPTAVSGRSPAAGRPIPHYSSPGSFAANGPSTPAPNGSPADATIAPVSDTTDAPPETAAARHLVRNARRNPPSGTTTLRPWSATRRRPSKEESPQHPPYGRRSDRTPLGDRRQAAPPSPRTSLSSSLQITPRPQHAKAARSYTLHASRPGGPRLLTRLTLPRPTHTPGPE